MKTQNRIFHPCQRHVSGEPEDSGKELSVLYPADKSKVIYLCGSGRFIQQLIVKTMELEHQGNIVLGSNPVPEWHGADCLLRAGRGNAVQCGMLQQRRIDLADEVLVLNVDGILDESTRSEIDYAHLKNKPVCFLEHR